VLSCNGKGHCLGGLVLLLGVERLNVPARAVLNIIGNSVATVVIARWEGAYDAELAGRARSAGTRNDR